MMLHRYLQSRYIAGNSSVNRLSPALDLSFLLPKLKNFSTDEYTTMDNDGMSVPPLACGFAKMTQHQHVVSVVDEDGYLVLYNTHKTGKAAVIKTWQVHANAVFDVEWFNEENKLLTGSGDQTIALYDVETCQRQDIFRGHASSVKSISNKVNDNAVFVSGSRDGHIMLWDKRIYHKDEAVPPVDTIFNAHMLHQSIAKSKKKNQSHLVKDAQQSVTVVLFQNENYLISAGAGDGCLKVWDVRKTYKRKTGAQPVYTFHYPGTNTRKYGYSSLVLDSQGRRLFASCTDDVIYEYDMVSCNHKPVRTWRGHKNSTFYVKSALSSDDQYLISGSSDEMAYIWQVNKPGAAPIALECHTAEVTGVAWCPNDITKVVTLSDDTKTKFWRIFCRELKKQYLPPWLGHAKRTPKTSEISRVAEDEMSGTSTPSSPSISVPKKASLQKSGSGSPQSCIRTWLKRKATSAETVLDQEAVPEKYICNNDRVDKSRTSLPDSVLVTKKKEIISKLFSAAGDRIIKSTSSCDNTVSIKSVPTLNKETSSASTFAPLLKKRSHDESQGLPSLDSDVNVTGCCKAEQTDTIPAENISPKRLKVEHPKINSEENGLAKDHHQDENSCQSCSESSHIFPSKTNSSSPVKSTQGSPSKSRKHVEQDSENVSPVKLKRKLNYVESPTSPKRQCLTNLDSNCHPADICGVKATLFTDGTLQETSASLGNHVQQTADKPFHVFTKSNEADMKSECDTNAESEAKGSSRIHSEVETEETCLTAKKTPSKERLSCVGSMFHQETLNIQSTEDTNFNSPTRNLPNLVMDEPDTCVATTPKSKSGGRHQRQNWLTQIRLDKLKKSPQIVPAQTNQGKLSPKVTKGMRKINSYFK